MGRLNYRMLAAALCTVAACAHHPRQAPQPADTAYYSSPDAGYSSSSAAQSGAGHSGADQSRSGQSSEEKAQAAPPDQSDTRADTRTHQTPPADSSPGVSSGSEAGQHPRGPQHLAAAGPGVAAGMPVQTESGSPLGFVVDVLPGAGGSEESGYVVIVGGSDATTPVPYGAARSMVRDGSVVIDHARFASAPKVKQSQIEDPSATGWKAKADHFWGDGSAHASGPSEEDPSDEDGRDRGDAPPHSDPDLDSSSDLPPPPPQSPQPLSL